MSDTIELDFGATAQKRTEGGAGRQLAGVYDPGVVPAGDAITALSTALTALW